jgi:hypothetical protein
MPIQVQCHSLQKEKNEYLHSDGSRKDPEWQMASLAKTATLADQNTRLQIILQSHGNKNSMVLAQR